MSFMTIKIFAPAWVANATDGALKRRLAELKIHEKSLDIDARIQARACRQELVMRAIQREEMAEGSLSFS